MYRSLATIVCLASGLIPLAAFGQPTAAKEEMPPPADFYVAVGGRDDWSGKLPSANAAGTDGPLATLAAARDKVRALKKSLPASEWRNLNVMIRAGTYVLEDPVVFGIEDSAPGDLVITYESYSGRDAHLHERGARDELVQARHRAGRHPRRRAGPTLDGPDAGEHGPVLQHV